MKFIVPGKKQTANLFHSVRQNGKSSVCIKKNLNASFYLLEQLLFYQRRNCLFGRPCELILEGTFNPLSWWLQMWEREWTAFTFTVRFKWLHWFQIVSLWCHNSRPKWRLLKGSAAASQEENGLCPPIMQGMRLKATVAQG